MYQVSSPTVVDWPPERISVMAFAMEGFSATHSTRFAGIRKRIAAEKGDTEAQYRAKE
jgi:hypothetical protein